MDKYLELVAKAIKSSNAFIGSTDVRDLSEIVSVRFSHKIQEEIISILRSGE